MLIIVVITVALAESIEYWAVLAHPEFQLLIVSWIIFFTILTIGFNMWAWLKKSKLQVI
jgi:hypothetical protein